MDTRILQRIIEDQRDEIERKVKRENIINRGKTDEIKEFVKHPNILTILGVRRCGKSILSYLIFGDEKFGHINFDDERLSEFKVSDFDNMLEAFYGIYGKELNCFIFDEIQNVDMWEKFVSRLRMNNRIIITGSNSKLLSSEISTSLTGRHIDYTLFPFSFEEFLLYNGVKPNINLTRDIGVVKNLLNKYINSGGFPETYTLGKNILMSIYNDIIEKDVIRRYKIRKVNEVRSMARYLVANFSSEISYNKLKNILNLNISTAKKYSDYISAVYMVFFIEKFSYKPKKQITGPRKVYCMDNGIANIISLKFSENTGKLMENLTAIHLMRLKANNMDFDVFYWKDYQQREVDFVIKEGLKVSRLIQVTYASGKDEIAKREIKGLIKGSDELKCDNLYMVTWDYEDEGNFDGKTIKFIPLWKWLINLN